jgi:bifunctional DNA-binding transcriptional regulator/antitoxin component of YhaV-PrlF toxin-antitoxin module
MAKKAKQSLGLGVSVAQDGTIKLPDDMLEYARIKKGGTVEVFADAQGLYIRTMEDEELCDFCLTPNGKTHSIGDKRICHHCMTQIRDTLETRKSKELGL